ncbi:hypothetical protein BIY22_16040 [Vibrio panuliri]|uniref:NTP pyrophosphohydrolase MazG putative catalytic core domain-containing protein n=1 Tax=Vibrio panuliri TaxID=1381081 RepID=A0A1Q9HNE1_9VIBR|nr:hypothetical protein [Vibrio panuliri]OLQ92323.1 hypothetical protein BIY22_16040 [Vibrio panuliri]
MLETMKLAQAKKLGTQGFTRTLDFDLAKLVEEVGELAIEVQINQGRLPQSKGGDDGIVGEAVDVVNVALDIAFLAMAQTGDLTVEQMAETLRHISARKLARWEKKVSLLESNNN